jgi:Domain of unknown function (DUF4249)
MGRTTKLLLFSLLLLTLHGQCVDKYNSPYTSPSTGYLVVEGYISGNSPTRYTLSRTIPLPGDSAIPMETGASVQVEGNDNSVYPLTEQNTGNYGTTDTLPLNTATQYRLRITTAAGEQFLSSYVPYEPTPPIDSVNWIENSNGVQIYVNTHDPANATRYYQWEYGETWAYESAEQSIVEYKSDTSPVAVISRPAADQIYRCWHADSSVNILINSTAKLAQDVVYRQPLVSIPSGSQQISILYSIFVRQYALTQDGYNFLSLMKSNTESLGTIFDPQPSQLKGNIQCLTSPNEPVVGYISAGTVQQQRIFISRYQLSDWYYFYACPIPDTVVQLGQAYLIRFFGDGGYIPVQGDYSLSGVLLGWDGNLEGCIDCRLQGGTTQEPSWWPN